MVILQTISSLLNCSTVCLHIYRIRIEMVLLKSNVLSEVQRSLLDGGLHIEDLLVDPLPRFGSSPRLGQHQLPTDSPERMKEPYFGMGGPAGLWHFIYRSSYLDQYVSSEFASPINSPQQQKRWYNLMVTFTIVFFRHLSFYAVVFFKHLCICQYSAA